MVKKISGREIENVLNIKVFDRLQQCRSYEEADQELERIKEEVKALHRQRLKELHPDLNPGIPDDRIKSYLEIYELFLKLRVERPAPRPSIRIYMHASGFGWGSTDATSTSAYG